MKWLEFWAELERVNNGEKEIDGLLKELDLSASEFLEVYDMQFGDDEAGLVSEKVIRKLRIMGKKTKSRSDDGDHDSVCAPDLAADCSFNCPKRKRGSHGYKVVKEESRSSSASNSAHKKPETQVDENMCSDDYDNAMWKRMKLRIEKAIDKKLNFEETPVPLLEQERVKKSNVNDIARSNSLSKQEERLKKREKLLEQPTTSPQPPKPKKTKKAKKENLPKINITPPDLPIRFRNMITGMEGTEIQMVIQKKISNSDVNHNLGRLSMPLSQITAVNFLTGEECAYLNNQSEGIPGMDVSLIDTKLEKRRITLKRWNLSKGNGKTNPWYVLISTWNDLVYNNGLEPDNIVQVWSFRVKSELHLAIVLVKGDAAAAADVDDHGISQGNDTGIGSSSTVTQSKEDTQKQEE